MKDFTTPEYITPIIQEIKATYTPEYHQSVLNALRCIVVLNKNGSRDALAIRTPAEGAFYITNRATRKVYAELKAWKEAAETEPGELDRWKYNEEFRIMETVRVALIAEYGKTA